MPPATHSLEGRLHLGLGLSLAVLVALAWWLGHDALHRSTEAYVLSRLQHDTEALLGGLREIPAEATGPARDGMMPIYAQPLSGHYFKVLRGGEAVRSRSLWDQDIALDPLSPGAVRHWKSQGPAGQRLLVRAAGYRLAGGDATLAVAEDLTPLEGILRRFEWLMAGLAAAGLSLMLLVQRTIVRRTFRRLRPVYRDIEALEQGTTRRLTEAVPREIAPLVRKLNGLLEVYERRLERSRNAAGNLAHALKGPLNLLRQELAREGDTDGASPAGGGRALCREQVERVRALVERELKRARIAGAGRPGSYFEPAAEMPMLADLLRRMYHDKGLAIACDTPPGGAFAVDREDMLELLGTLLDNACKWAAGRVRCVMDSGPAGGGERTNEAGQAGLRVRIEDDGPGCPPEELAAIAARGARLDESIAGHGLGLSIAREIVESYGGRLDLGPSPDLGGFSARVWIPVARVRRLA
jgi:signal transduction histidine kinase